MRRPPPFGTTALPEHIATTAIQPAGMPTKNLHRAIVIPKRTMRNERCLELQAARRAREPNHNIIESSSFSRRAAAMVRAPIAASFQRVRGVAHH